MKSKIKKSLVAIHFTLTVSLIIITILFLHKPDRLIALRNQIKGIFIQYEPNEVVSQIKEDIDSSHYVNQTELIDNVRSYIHNNSIHKEYTDYHTSVALHLDKRFKVLEDIYAFNHKNKFQPELSCTPRTWAMQEVLRSYNIPFRIINIYFTERPKGELTSHTFLEAYNTDKRKWEIQDPDRNIYYSDSLSSRLSSLDLMYTGDKSKILACKGKGDCKEEYKYWLNFKQSFKAIKIS